MYSDRHIWQGWAQKLHSWGLGGWTASILENAGPLTWLGAQIVYLGQPLLSQAAPKSQIQALVELLEDPESAKTFIGMLKEEILQ
jgi:hypothetical protein